MLRRDRIDGLVAFLRRLVNRAGERSYLVLKPTVEERAWRKDVKERHLSVGLCDLAALLPGPGGTGAGKTPPFRSTHRHHAAVFEEAESFGPTPGSVGPY